MKLIEHYLNSYFLVTDYYDESTGDKEQFSINLEFTDTADSTYIETYNDDYSNITFLAISADYEERIDEISTTWNIEHNLDYRHLITQVYVPRKSTNWYIYHGLNTKNIVFQCYDTEYNVISPSAASIDENYINIGFDGEEKGTVHIAEATYYSAESSSTTWNETHNLNTWDIIVQARDSNDAIIKPNKIYLNDKNSVTLEFDSAKEGYMHILRGNVIHTQSVSSNTWYVEHYLENHDIIVETYETSGAGYVKISNPNITHISKDIVKISLDHACTGIALVRIADVVGMVGEKEEPKTLQLTDKDNITVTFARDTKGYIVCKKATYIGWGLQRAYPKTHKTVNSNNCIATFSENIDGVACLKKVSSLPYHGNLIMSPHYKVELDLSCEPLCISLNNKGITSDKFIINEKYANQLIESWEETRPACKYSHYHWLVSPTTDFSKEYIPLYDVESPVNIYTKCCVDTTTVTLSAHYIEPILTESNLWDINHDLLTNNILVQCYSKTGSGYEIVYPDKILIVSNNRIKIYFKEAVSGVVLIAKSIYGFTDFDTNTVEASATWGNIEHNIGEEVLSDYFDLYEKQFLPENVEIIDNNHIKAELYVQALGKVYISDNDYLHTQSSPTATWTVRHNLGYRGVIVQTYNDDNMLIPNRIVLVSSNQCKIYFDNSESGYAIVKAVGALDTQSTLYLRAESIRIGTGTTGPYWNGSGLKNEVALTTKLTKNLCEDNYYIDGTILCDRNDRKITEIGIFDEFDTMLFYTYINGELFKPKEVEFSVHYIIRKN